MNNVKQRKLKILIYGEPFEWAMAYNLQKSYKDLGHEAKIFDWTQWLFRTKKYNLKNRIMDRLLFYRVAKNINNDLINTFKNKDYSLIIVLKGIHLFPETIATAKKFVDYIVNWNPDDFFNPLNNSKYLIDSFSKYDFIFTPRNHLRDEYYKKSAKRIEFLIIISQLIQVQDDITIFIERFNYRFYKCLFNHGIRITKANNTSGTNYNPHIIHKMFMIINVVRHTHDYPFINNWMSAKYGRFL